MPLLIFTLGISAILISALRIFLLLKGRMMCFWQIQPIYTYHILLLFFIFKEKYAAPELFKENTVPTLACDIYSLGKVMEYLYSYSHLSPGIRHVIFKATHPEPTKRYTNVEEMKKAFGASRYIDRSVQV